MKPAAFGGLLALLLVSPLLGAPQGPDLGVPQRLAKASLDMQVWRWDQRLEPSLRAASERGVRLRLLLDPKHEVNRRAARALRGPQVELRWASLAPDLEGPKAMLLVDSGQLWALSASRGAKKGVWRLSAKGAEASEAAMAFERRWKEAMAQAPSELILNDALKALPDPRGDDERLPRFKQRSLEAPQGRERQDEDRPDTR